MADVVFNRQYHLFFSIPLIPTVDYGDGWKATPKGFTADDILKYEEVLKSSTEGDQTLSYVTREQTYGFSDLNIKVKIKKSIKSESNTCELKVYNADSSLVKQLDAYQGKGIACEMRVGYGYDNTTLPLIFTGTVSSAVSKSSGGNIITTIKVTDGGKNFQETYTSRSYKKNTPIGSIVDDLVNDLGLQKGFIQNIVEADTKIPAVLKQAKAYAGKVQTSLKRIADTFRMNFSVQDGHVYMCEQGKRVPLFGSTPILSESTGVIDKLRVADTNSGTLSNDTDNNRARYTIKTLMRPDIIPGTTVFVVDDEDKNIPYKVEEVEHEGEFEGQDWSSTLELSIAEEAT